MAEKVLSNIVEGIMNSLNGPLAAIVKLQKLGGTVSAIKSVLLRVEEQLAPNHEVDHWLEELNDVIYNADDLLDAASTEALRLVLMTQDGRAEKVRTFFFKTYQFDLGRKMGRKIKAIGKKLDDIKDRIETESNDWAELSNLERFPDAIIIGREDDKKAIINCLMDSNIEEDVSFLPIVGRRGLGKTALAQLIYHDEVIIGSFDLKMWVSVGDAFDIRIIDKNLLGSASRGIGEISKLDGLKDEFRDAIVGRKYFLVLDNLCNEDSEKWCELQNLLMNGARGSRILITTRSEKVAKKLGHPRKPHYLRGLAYEDSWHLFVRLTSPARERLENPCILEMARKIVQRCAGIPRITKMVASSFLSLENSEAGWCDSMEKLLKSSQDENDVLPPIPQLSYNMLPSQLKCCFAYCSLFPKGYIICKATLIKLWIAQGFVKSQDNLWLEDLGHEYFIDLLRDKFFHEPKFDEFGNIISCKVHDLMHELAKSMAGLLITMLEKKEINKKTLHVGFISFSPPMPSMLCKIRSIRTFFYSNLHTIEGECDCETIFSRFKLLRVLDLHDQDLKHIPRSISKLNRLRYLDLSDNKEIMKLPKFITSLLNLQTIRLSGCCSLKRLPKDIKRLVNLRHLELDNCRELRYMPRGLGQLTKLQTLTLFVVDSGSLSKHCAGLNELNGLKNLRGKMVVRYSHTKGVMSKHQAANLKEEVPSLYMKWCDNYKSLECLEPLPNLKQLLIEKYWDLRFSRWLLSLTSLVELKLLQCNKCQCLPPLSQLRSLKCLWLKEMDAIEYISECGDQNVLSSSSSTPVEVFPALEAIHISSCPKLMVWCKDFSMEADGGSHNLGRHLLRFFPCLSSLYISKCPLFISMPSSHLCSLKYLRLEEMDAIEYISACTDQNEFSSSSSTLVEILPTLETVHISNCPKLKSWWRDSSMEVGGRSHSLEHHLLPFFPCLSSLHISKCPLLISMPRFPYLKELYLEDANWKPLLRTMMTKSATSSFFSLWKARTMTLVSMTDVRTLLEDWLRKFTCSWSLLIKHCDKLESLSVEHCDKLESLLVKHCDKFESLSVKQCHKLESLTVEHCDKLESLIVEHCEKLKSLIVEHCDKLKSLTIQHLKALEKLKLTDCYKLVVIKIGDCENLTTILEGFGNYNSLCMLEIVKCPKLISLSVKHCDKLKSLSVKECHKLESLTVEHCDKLESLMVEKCHKLKSLMVKHLTALEKLKLTDFYMLEVLKIRDCENLIAILKEINKHNSLFMLEIVMLEIVRCPNLPLLLVKHCEKLDSLLVKQCHKLESLTVEHCEKLEFLTVEHGDKLKFLTIQHLKAFEKLKLINCNMLDVIKIWDCENLTDISKWILSCNSFYMLQIFECPELKSLPIELFYKLKSLSVKHCNKLESLIVKHCLKLEFLTVEHCDKLEVLTVEHCDKLEFLTVGQCDKLKSLMVKHLTSLLKLKLTDFNMLKVLKIRDFENLTATPEGIDNHNSLCMVAIVRCPESVGFLTSLSVKHCEQLESLSVKHCEQLESLSVKHCEQLESLMVEHCEQLESLKVEHCDKVKSLTVEHGDKLKSLTIKHLKALEKLELTNYYKLKAVEIRDCEKLTAIP